MNWFHQAMMFALSGGDVRWCWASREIVGGGEWLEDCGGARSGLVVRGMEVEVRLLGCWEMESGVVGLPSGAGVCRGGV
jgi:hypothetical protein